MQVVVALADRDPRRRDEADIAVDVGVAQVLLRDAEGARCIDEFRPVFRARDLEKRAERDVVVGERGPGEGERVAARRGVERPRQHVADHGAVPRNAHIEIDSRRALDLDRFVHDRERGLCGPEGDEARLETNQPDQREGEDALRA